MNTKRITVVQENLTIAKFTLKDITIQNSTVYFWIKPEDFTIPPPAWGRNEFSSSNELRLFERAKIEPYLTRAVSELPKVVKIDGVLYSTSLYGQVFVKPVVPGPPEDFTSNLKFGPVEQRGRRAQFEQSLADKVKF